MVTAKYPNHVWHVDLTIVPILGGQILWGHGLHIAWAITSGRLVGQWLGQTGAAAEPNPTR